MFTRMIDQALSEKVDPKTGLPLVPLYQRTDGSFVWPILGASPDDDEDEDDTSSETEDDDEDTDEDETDEDEEDTSKSKKKPDPREVRIAQLEKRMRAADRRASLAEKRLKEIDDKDKSELQRVTEERDDLKKQIEALSRQQRESTLQNAFLTANSFKWADVGDALTVAERGGYLEDVFDDDGKIDKKALKLAVKNLAKEKPYLLAGKSSEDEDDTGSEDETPKGTSGTPVGSGRKKVKGPQFSEEELRRKYPALGR